MTTVTATNTLLRFAGGLFQIRLRPRNSNNRNTVTVTRGLAVGTPLKEGVPNQPVTGRYTSKAVTPSTEAFLAGLVVAHEMAHTGHLADCLTCRWELRDVIDTLDWDAGGKFVDPREVA